MGHIGAILGLIMENKMERREYSTLRVRGFGFKV